MLRKTYELIYSIVRYYLDYHISRASAALSYFLMLTIFPLLICLYAVLGSLFPTAEELSELLGAFLPAGTLETLMDFLDYVSMNSNGRMLSFAVAAMATSSAAGYRIIDKLMFELRGIQRRERFWAFVFSFLFSLVFLAALYISALLMATGGWFIRFADEYIRILNISHNWEWLRFLLLFLLLFTLILGVYRITAPKESELVLLPGAVSATLAIVGMSIMFSWFIGMSVRYPLVYGSLASVMITLLWLYICGNVLFLGNILNLVLEKYKE